ncbi:nitroreductase family protein [Peptostreptococcus equinus]|uniref:Nitroreductase family protein n=1 Tax=Peptostreptococcus equinus TaxID=3003601 RepID=A0ABY7JM59_9FIRM|nr:nitroreductase family protein [Peptostreptococcus sp. CBA3647]WAW14440.1 nitroreductase family protein [Peptostreptococcus sp. CBA3647]
MDRFESMKKRRTYYDINDNVSIEAEKIIKTIEKAVELTPDAFNMQSSRAVIVLDKEQKRLWDVIENSFNGMVPAEKIESFRKGYGTVLYFIDEPTVEALQKQFELYADNFPIWAQQANGMAQYNVWVALRELDLGASLQHYNPVIDADVKKEFNIPETWKLVAQMPFGAIGSEPDDKELMPIAERVIVKK